MTQRLNLSLECGAQSAISDALLDLGYGSRNDIYFTLEFPAGESAFARYVEAVTAVNNRVLSTDYQGPVYLSFINVECVWGV